MPIKPSYLVLTGIGGIVAIGGVKGWGLSKSFRDVVAGQNPQTNPMLTAQITGASFYGYGVGANIGGKTGPTPPVRNVPGINQVNRVLGQTMAATLYGWTGNEWNSLDQLWTHESRWQNTIKNPTSTAYGIAQFLDTTWSGYGPKTSNPVLQIRYGLKYIKDRYGSPSVAWADWQSRSPHWY